MDCTEIFILNRGNDDKLNYIIQAEQFQNEQNISKYIIF